MITNDKARLEVRLMKALDGLKYSEFAQMVGLSSNTIYCWMNGKFNLGKQRLLTVETVIQDLKGE